MPSLQEPRATSTQHSHVRSCCASPCKSWQILVLGRASAVPRLRRVQVRPPGGTAVHCSQLGGGLDPELSGRPASRQGECFPVRMSNLLVRYVSPCTSSGRGFEAPHREHAAKLLMIRVNLALLSTLFTLAHSGNVDWSSA